MEDSEDNPNQQNDENENNDSDQEENFIYVDENMDETFSFDNEDLIEVSINSDDEAQSTESSRQAPFSSVRLRNSFLRVSTENTRFSRLHNFLNRMVEDLVQNEDVSYPRRDYVENQQFEIFSDTNFDTNLPTEHLYLGSDLENVPGHTIYEDFQIINLHVIPNEANVCPGFILPMTLNNLNYSQMLEQIMQGDHTFGMLYNKFVYQNSNTATPIGVTMQIYELSLNNREVKLKAIARQRFIIVDSPEKWAPLLGRGTSSCYVKVKILPEIKLMPSLQNIQLQSLNKHRYHKLRGIPNDNLNQLFKKEHFFTNPLKKRKLLSNRKSSSNNLLLDKTIPNKNLENSNHSISSSSSSNNLNPNMTYLIFQNNEITQIFRQNLNRGSVENTEVNETNDNIETNLNNTEVDSASNQRLTTAPNRVEITISNSNDNNDINDTSSTSNQNQSLINSQSDSNSSENETEMEFSNDHNMFSLILDYNLYGLKKNRKLRKYDAAVQQWPLWVHDFYDETLIMNKIRHKLKNFVHVLPPDPVKLSFWIIQNYLLEPSERTRALIQDNAIQRLNILLNFMQKKRSIACFYCDDIVGRQEDLFPMSKDGIQSNYCNPDGFIHETVTLLKLKSLRVRLWGPPRTEFSWFPGYSWTILNCNVCNHHLGWRFNALKPDAVPQAFYGLTRQSTKIKINTSD